MDFIERDLEDIIFNTDPNLLEDRGLSLLFNAHTYRQLQIGEYGIADIVQFKIDKDPYFDGKEYRFHNVIRLKIIELKKDEINLSTFLQALNYAKGLKSFYEKRERKIKSYCKLEISIVLIGKKINTKDSFVYLTDFLNNPKFELDLYTYKYDFDGISFDYQYAYKLINEGLKDTLSYSKYKKTEHYTNYEQDN